jgi:large conductance mechanosensitive channel
MIQEFRDFIKKGDFIEIAVGFVMGVAFTTVVTAFVDRLINPAIGLIFDVGDLDALGTFGDNGSLGAVIGAVINLILVGLVLFLVVKAYNRMKTRDEAAGETESSEEVRLLSEIRDALLHADGRSVGDDPGQPYL